MEAGSLIIQRVPYDNECTQTGSAAALHLHSPHGGNTVTTVKKKTKSGDISAANCHRVSAPRGDYECFGQFVVVTVWENISHQR